MTDELDPFREGARAEYFAQYLLSAFGTSVAVPRQEDQGIDFFCNLQSSNGTDLPTFEHPLYVQVKLGEPKEVEYGGLTSGKKWRKHPVQWLLHLELPLLLGFVDTEKHTLTLHQTSPRWFVYFETLGKGDPAPFMVKIKPGKSDPKWPHKKNSRSKFAKKITQSDGSIWHCDVGKPLEVIRVEDLKDPKRKRRIASVLRDYIDLERKSIAHGLLGNQWAYWPTDIGWEKKSFRPAFVIEEKHFPQANSGLFYKEFTPPLCSLLLRLKAEGASDKLADGIALFKRLSDRLYYPTDLRRIMEKMIPELK